MINRRRVHAEAMRLALSIHRRLGTDLTKQIDVYDAITQLGVTLAFEPLHNLSGAYLAGPDTGGLPGIIINARHPRSRQRYSAGHELGHHLRDGDLVLDAETDLLARDPIINNEPELAAEAFASWFLMPPTLVRTLIRQLDIGKEPSPDDVYRLSLGLGTSYLATVHHLFGLKMLNRPTLHRLASVTPKWIKSQLAVHGPGDSWGDVWRIRREGQQQSVTPQPGDEIIVELEETPSTGFIWRIHGQPDHVRIVESTFQPPVPETLEAEEAFGAIGARLVVLQAEEPGTAELQLVRQRPWEKDDPEPAEQFRISFSIQQKNQGFMPIPAHA